MTVGRSDTMVVTSIMNTGGTMGGVIGIPIVAYLSVVALEAHPQLELSGA